MGNSKSKKKEREPEKFFDREKWKETKREELKKKAVHSSNKRNAMKESTVGSGPAGLPTRPPPTASPSISRSYDQEALERMRYQLHNDSDAFLLNNILLSVQFFENYEREIMNMKDNAVSKREHRIDEAMVRHHKHIFFADRLQECVHDHVRYMRRRGCAEALVAPRLFVIYDNVEACEPGDTSDYSAVLDAPFYKLRVEDCKESGYVKLKKLEVLESVAKKTSVTASDNDDISLDSVYSESEKESNESDDDDSPKRGEELLQKLKIKLEDSEVKENMPIRMNNVRIHETAIDVSGRRRSGPVRQLSSQVERSNISNLNNIRKLNSPLIEENERRISKDLSSDMKEAVGTSFEENEMRPRKSILKNGNARRFSGPIKEIKNKSSMYKLTKNLSETSISEDTETSGYRSTCSSRQNESSETESDYGYSTITESTTPKRLQLSMQTNLSVASGVLPDECWSPIQIRALDQWSEDEDDEFEETAPKGSPPRNLYETVYYLNSVTFMTNFVDNFMIKLGSGLGLTQDAINDAVTQGASVYCDLIEELKTGYEIIPALLSSWPNAANQWIIRERRIIQNPRTNFNYQWPTKYMVSKAIGFGCLIVPIGFRPKRGANPDQKLQWRVIFPAAERYLESCLAHSHIRCYLFALILHKTFLENDTSKIGIDASHIKNHLFWQCEDNYARWPEDRLGETLRLFLKSFYAHFGMAKFPNYFVESCNDFKSIPKPVLLKTQRKLADILEAPVMHVLSAIEKLNYIKKDFYPVLNIQKLYLILTCKNPLRVLNPNLQSSMTSMDLSADSDDDGDNSTSFWERAKAQDKHYQWKKERQRQMQEKRRVTATTKKSKNINKADVEINRNIILSKRMEPERRRLVLDFFIPHFIAMARTSEKFDAIKQAVIFLEQAQRLCTLLQEEPAGADSANDYMDVIRDKLNDCQRKLVNQGGYKLPQRTGSYIEKIHMNRYRKQRPKYENIINQESPTENPGISAFSFVDVHSEPSTSFIKKDTIKFSDMKNGDSDEESKL